MSLTEWNFDIWLILYMFCMYSKLGSHSPYATALINLFPQWEHLNGLSLVWAGFTFTLCCCFYESLSTMGTAVWFVTCVSWVHLHSMLLLRWISFHNGNSCWKVEIKTIQLFILWKDIRWCSRIDSVWTSSHHDKLFSCFHCKKIFINKQNEGILTSSLVHQVACIWENLSLLS